MTREELIECLTILQKQARHSGANTFIWDINLDSFNFVIDNTLKELKQESTTNKMLNNLRAEIETNFANCDICEYVEYFDYEANYISEYKSIGSIADILKIIDKYKTESERA